MVNKALWVRLEAKPGREADLNDWLHAQLANAQGEPNTTAWFAVRLGPATFGIFDAFPDDAGRDEHLAGEIAKSLKDIAADMLASAPSISRIDVLAAKLPDAHETPDSLG